MKITKILLLSLAVVFMSCGDDDKDEAQPGASGDGLPGAWTATAIEYEGTTTTSVSGIELESTFTGKGKDMGLTVTFKETPATFTSEGKYTIALTTTTMGYSTTQDYPFTGFMTDGTWALDGKTLTINGAGGVQTATVVEQTSTALKMEWDFVNTTTQQGATVEMKVHGTYTFKRK